MKACHEAGEDPAAVGLERLDGWWNEAKAIERASTRPPDDSPA